MAKLKLDRDECRDDFLPHRCMRCGEPTDEIVKRSFSWTSPYWYFLLCVGIGILIVIIIRIVLAKRMTVNIPLCPRHRNHWAKCTAIVVLLIFADIALLFSSQAFTNDLDPKIRDTLFFSSLFFILVSLIVMVMISNMQIRPTYIDDDSIELAGVNQEFKEEVEKLQAEADEEYRTRKNRQLGNGSKPAKPIILDDIPKKGDEPQNELYKID